MRKNELDKLTGKRFSRLLVSNVREVRNKRTYWWCSCTCGAFVAVRKEKLTNGTTTSCGCAMKERNHNYTKTHRTLYTRWQGIVQRCHSPTHHKFSSYGARGITVCERWRTSFVHFLSDVGEPPAEMVEPQLDRINVKKGYSPTNVQWLPFDEHLSKSWQERKGYI